MSVCVCVVCVRAKHKILIILSLMSRNDLIRPHLAAVFKQGLSHICSSSFSPQNKIVIMTFSHNYDLFFTHILIYHNCKLQVYIFVNIFYLNASI